MDLKLLIFANSILLGILNAVTPVYCHFTDSAVDPKFGDDLSLDKYSLNETSGPLESTETTEPDSSGDAERSSGDESLSDLMSSKPSESSEEPTTHLNESASSPLLSQSTDESPTASDESSKESSESSSFEANKSESSANESDEKDLLSLLFDNVSSEYADDYNKSVEQGTSMDDNKEYSVKSFVPSDSILVLATPSGCSLMEFEETEDGPQMAEFSFKTSQLEDCVKLNEDILNEMTDQLAKQIAQYRGPTTKMVEISVRDPMRSANLNIKETTQVFKNSTKYPDSAQRSSSNEFADDLASSFDEDIVTDDQDQKDARLILSELLDFGFLPTNSDSVYIMSYSYRDQEAEKEMNKNNLYNEFFSVFNDSQDSETDEKSKEDKDKDSKERNDKSYDSLKNLKNFSKEKFDKAVEEMKKLLETEEGKKEVEMFSKELEKRFHKTKQLLQKELETGKQILDDLSKHGIENVQCSKLSKDECSNYTKCEMMDVDGKDLCFVSPKTIYWLMETNCGLQSKSALMSIARDLNNVGFISNKRVNFLEQLFDSTKICNAITHSYLSKLAPKVDQQPNNAFN